MILVSYTSIMKYQKHVSLHRKCGEIIAALHAAIAKTDNGKYRAFRLESGIYHEQTQHTH